jgi:glycine/D-amino acid oxidase-like deaminating enzyme
MHQLEPIGVLVIGAGLFGSVIAAWLRRQGHPVTVFDDENPYAGSGPAACLAKPSWLSSFTSVEQNQSFTVLDALYGVQDLEAKLLFNTIKFFWVPPSKILCADRYERRRVIGLGVDSGGPYYRLGEYGRTGATGNARTIIVAAGVWSKDLVEVPGLQPQAGVAFTWNPGLRGNDYAEPRIRPWAPYKQLVSFMRAPGELWCGDGSALKPESFTDQRFEQSLRRCADFVDQNPLDATRYYGFRPYIRGLGKPCYLEQPLPGIWVATGGAKNGMSGAGWAAWQLGQALK